MTSTWEEMWRKPFYDDVFDFGRYLAARIPASTTTTEYRSVGITVWHEQDSRHGDEAWKEREGKA